MPAKVKKVFHYINPHTEKHVWGSIIQFANFSKKTTMKLPELFSLQTDLLQRSQLRKI
jgi:hypothetical protein